MSVLESSAPALDHGAALGHHHGVDHQRHILAMRCDRIADRLDHWRRVQHAGFDAVRTNVVQHDRNLLPDEVNRHLMDAMDAMMEETPDFNGGPFILARGDFVEIDALHGGQGTATVYQAPDSTRFVRLEPDAAHPNKGICIKGQAAPELVYDPLRLRYP